MVNTSAAMKGVLISRENRKALRVLKAQLDLLTYNDVITKLLEKGADLVAQARVAGSPA